MRAPIASENTFASERPCAMRAIGALLVAGMVLCGCVVGPDYKAPPLVVADAWHESLAEGLTTGESTIVTWWEVFEDENLTALIERAARGNLDLIVAFDRIREARALRGIAAADLSPDLDAFGHFERGRFSESTQPLVPERTSDFYSPGIDATWEIDVWGRIRRSVESADASMVAQIENYRDVLVLLYAEIALNYIDVRSLQRRIDVAESNLETQRGAVQLTKDRFEADLAAKLDVHQAELNEARTESLIPQLRAARARAVHRLGVLVGEHPAALAELLAAGGDIPRPPPEVSVGVPVDLLRQRPDVRRAEREYAAQVALIGVATADLYPRFSLSGAFAYESSRGSISEIFDSKNRAWFWGPSFRWNLLDGQRIRNNIRTERARTDQAEATYYQTVLLALEDVENSIVGYVEESRRRAVLERSVEAARKSAEMVETIYKSGLTDFQNVLDMQRSQFEEEDRLVASEGEVARNLVLLYRSLGGGWNPGPQESTEELVPVEQEP